MGCSNGKANEEGKKENSGYPMTRMTIPVSLEVHSLVAPSDDKILLGAKDELQLYDSLKQSITTVSKEHTGRINCLLKLSNGKIVSAGQDKTIKLWDINKSQSLCSLTGHKSMIWCIGEVEKNKVMSGSSDRFLKLWDLNGKKFEGDIFKGTDEVSAAISLKNGKILLCSGSKLIKIDLSTKKEEKSIEVKGGIWSLHLLKDGTVAAGLGNGDVVIYDVNDDIKVKTNFSKHHKKAVSFIIELDNSKIISASDEENDLVLWDPKDSESKYIISGHTDSITGLTFISGNKFASVSKDKTLKIWE